MALNRFISFSLGLGFLLSGSIVAVFSFAELYGGHGPASQILEAIAWIALIGGFFVFGFGIAWILKTVLDITIKVHTRSRGFVVNVGLLIGGIIAALFGYSELDNAFSIIDRLAASYEHTALDSSIETLSKRLRVALSVTAAGAIPFIVGVVLTIRAMFGRDDNRRR